METHTSNFRRGVAGLLVAGVMHIGPGPANAKPPAPGASGPEVHGQTLAVNLSARLAMEPADVLVHTRIDPDPRNARLTIEWWSDDGVGGSHSISLDGGRAPLRQDCAIRAMVSGQYVVTAILTRNDGSEVRRGTTLTVMGTGADVDPIASRGLAEH